MERKNRLFIYDRKEIGALILLGVLVAAFAFTLGIHLGKRVAVKGTLTIDHDAAPVGTKPDNVPNRQDLTEQGKTADQAAEDTLNQALHDEVARTGIRIDQAKPVELPEHAASAAGGATTIESRNSVGRFTLQIGSYPVEEEARNRVAMAQSKGLKPFLREAEVQGRGKWYRVYLGGFATKEAAEAAGTRYRAHHVIDSYIVAKMVE